MLDANSRIEHAVTSAVTGGVTRVAHPPRPAGRAPNSLHIGDLVEVRRRDEILATLDVQGRLDGMPFMPEMLAFCGKRFRIYKLAHKTCDTVVLGSVRSLDHTVHLETRCDGSGHGGCQAGCLLYWREEWLRRIPDDATAGPASSLHAANESPGEHTAKSTAASMADAATPGCSEGALSRAAQTTDPRDGETVYSCQATRLHDFTRPLSPYHLPTYLRDWASGNVTFGAWLRGIAYINYERLINLGIGWGPLLRWLYDKWQQLTHGVPYPRRVGLIPHGQPTPSAALNLKEGEWVRVKSYHDILATCNVDLRNRGMSFDGEQVPYCGGTYRVLRRVERIIDERSGKMLQMKNPCIVLDGVVCKGRYSECRMFCPREIYSYWREVWLERADPPSIPAADQPSHRIHD